jgi:superfamily II DNA/RNA helicase
LKIDRNDPRMQILCLCHTRELANQITSVYKEIISKTEITLSNSADTTTLQPAQIVVTTMGALLKTVNNRNVKDKLDFKGLKSVVIDEADFFFNDEKNFQDVMKLHEKIILPLG